MCKGILQIGGGKLAVTIISGAELDLFLSIVFRSDIVLLEMKLAEHSLTAVWGGWVASPRECRLATLNAKLLTGPTLDCVT
jgi:hypothetical protein